MKKKTMYYKRVLVNRWTFYKKWKFPHLIDSAHKKRQKGSNMNLKFARAKALWNTKTACTSAKLLFYGYVEIHATKRHDVGKNWTERETPT